MGEALRLAPTLPAVEADSGLNDNVLVEFPAHPGKNEMLRIVGIGSEIRLAVEEQAVGEVLVLGRQNRAEQQGQKERKEAQQQMQVSQTCNLPFLQFLKR